jgi:GTP1/Obg family GTP-binding protein
VKVNSEVIYSTQLLKTINKYKNVVMDSDQVKTIAATIASANMTNREVKKEHVRGIKQAAVEKNVKIAHDICPKCGSSLVDRKGKYGAFKGCSGYPKCRFVVK